MAMIDEMDALTLGFSGPRPNKLCGWNTASYEGFIDDLSDRLFTYYKKGFKRYLNGAAQGFDQCAFWAVEKMKEKYDLKDVKNMVLVPFSGQERLWKWDGCFGQKEYGDMLNKADNVKVLAHAPNDYKEACRYLYNRNKILVKSAHLLLALYASDKWRIEKGGTEDAMMQAIHLDKQLHQITYIIQKDCVKISNIIVIR